MALTLLRHAPLPERYQGRYNGWSDIPIDPALTDNHTIEALKRHRYDKIYSSDLLRCTQTLDLIGFPCTTDKRLREVRFKPHIEGKTFEEVSQFEDFDPALLENASLWHALICDESETEFIGRIESFLCDIDMSEEILVCTHGGVISRIMRIFDIPYRKIDYLHTVRIENELP